ncbi:carbon storage regulator CsrA [Paenibacillus nasutitermitis]|uniref:Translational regulator CsrA n=1 Tax=Paenibacillus nasutitermitis TaxID=1652958 RepID=A0A916ZER5_9BACL|nr:carbon storage regulator CsrA [Paenibacillus nasutitermitis]GGD92211.1 carbon storage regulator [Paenibacillus nasutitermitis]
MLVLSRKKGESVIIDGQIEVTVLGVEGDTIRLGIAAPKDIDIFRKEVFLSIQESNREAAAPAPGQLEALMKRLRGSQQEK